MILVYSYFPLFDKHLAGGMQSWARGLLEGLYKKGLDIQLVCPNSKLHSFPKDFKVHHVLNDSEVDGLEPRKYYEDLIYLKELEQKADIIWTFDRSFPIKSNKKKILSLGTFCYEREMKCIFQDDYDIVVVPSQYTKGQFDFYRNDIKIIPMFIESNISKKKIDKQIINKYFKYCTSKKYILFPHRPEFSKGHYDALEILKLIIKEDSSYTLCIPEPPNSRLADAKAETDFIEELKDYVRKNNLENNVVFHKWVERIDMPYYLSIGEFALFMTKLPETFGISLINCISCGLPVISYGSGALKEVVPENMGHYVIKDKDYNHAVDIILNKEYKLELQEGIKYCKKYNKEKIVDEYYKILLSLQHN